MRPVVHSHLGICKLLRGNGLILSSVLTFLYGSKHKKDSMGAGREEAQEERNIWFFPITIYNLFSEMAGPLT